MFHGDRTCIRREACRLPGALAPALGAAAAYPPALIVDIADGFWLKSPFAQKINKCFTEETIRDQLVRSQQV
jgi:hypothetical protein